MDLENLQDLSYSISMRIISWNVNGIRAAEKKDFVPWLLNSGADVVLIQETKANPSQLNKSLLSPGSEEDDDAPLFSMALENPYYKSYFSSAKKAGYSGTAIYSKVEPDKVDVLGIKEFDDEGRATIAYFGKLVVISAYFPNSQGEGARLPYKLEFCKAIYEKCSSLVKQGYDIVLGGDYNIAHKPIDLAHPKANEKNAGYLPEEREWMDFFTTNGFVDTFRQFNDQPNQYNWWSYRMNAREKNIGWRIDYLCVNQSFMPKVKSASILSDVMGSDHCPVAIEIDTQTVSHN